MSCSAKTRREFLQQVGLSVLAGAGLSFWRPSVAEAFGDDDRFRLALLQYPSDAWDLRARALDSLLLEVEQTTSIQVARRSDTVALRGGDLSPFPMLFICGDRGFEAWSNEERTRLRRYVQAGGMLIFDSSEGRVDGVFRQSVERELEAILPEKKLTRTASSHVLYKSFYLCRGDEGRTTTADYTESIDDEGRLQVLYIHNDLLGAYARDLSGTDRLAVSGGARRRDYAFRFGVNLVMYALCLDYKEDQVHVPFILRRRRWSVP